MLPFDQGELRTRKRRCFIKTHSSMWCQSQKDPAHRPPCTAHLPHVLSCASVPEGLARRLGHHSDRLERNATLPWTHMPFPRMPPGYSISLADRMRACFRQGTNTGCGVGGAVGVLTGSCLPLWSTPSLCGPDLPGFWGWNSTGTEAYGAFCESPRAYRKTAWTNVT